MQLVEPLLWLEKVLNVYIKPGGGGGGGGAIKAVTRQFLDEMTPLQGAKPKGGQTSLTIFGQDWMDFECSVNMYLEINFRLKISSRKTRPFNRIN